MIDINKELLIRLDRPGPRYTSYPTAPEWNDAVSEENYRKHLQSFSHSDKTLSLYVHIPFCESLCYFCGCMMNVRPQEERYGDEYIDVLEKELDLICRELGHDSRVRQLHWGGGTPSFLSENQIKRLYALIAERFDIDADGEIAVEVDPRRVTKQKVCLLRDLGFNRISIGLQDFNEEVQKAVNRIQPYGMVKQFHGWCRDVNFQSINFDLIYGLPCQTKKSFHETIEQVLSLVPDRIALYSFAYVPWLKKHQSKMNEDRLPDADQKLDIFLQSREQLLAHGYEAIAMDHFARKNDDLAKAFRIGTLHRNFMGYTVRPADEFIGVGVSAIGFLERGFFQNAKTLPEYYDLVRSGILPVKREKILSEDDIIRQWTIQSFMCRFILDRSQFNQKFGTNFNDYFLNEKDHLSQCEQDGLLTDDGSCIRVTELGRLFVRNISMGFDQYLHHSKDKNRFSKTV